ncbi:outer membrane efflux family protein, partial [Vibrio parahaemolyticus V-223/04]
YSKRKTSFTPQKPRNQA